ncbi:unnamed protein product [Urochloa humidicola]
MHTISSYPHLFISQQTLAFTSDRAPPRLPARARACRPPGDHGVARLLEEEGILPSRSAAGGQGTPPPLCAPPLLDLPGLVVVAAASRLGFPRRMAWRPGVDDSPACSGVVRGAPRQDAAEFAPRLGKWRHASFPLLRPPPSPDSAMVDAASI